MTIKRVFKSTIPNISFIFKSGKSAPFLSGSYATDSKVEIDELMTEIEVEGYGKSSQPHLYVDLTEREIDSEALSPLEIIKKKAREEVKAEIMAAMDKNKVSSSVQSAVLQGLGTTESLAELNAGSSNSSDEALNASAKIDALKAVFRK